MSDHTYKHIKLTGTSAESIEDAVQKAVAKAATTVHKIRWFQVIDTRGSVEDGKVSRWQVTVEVGFTLDD